MKKNVFKWIFAAVLSVLFCSVFIIGCSNISKIKNSITGDEFTDIAQEYGLDVECKTTGSLTTYIAQGNNIYVEFYMFETETYIDTSYEYIVSSIESAFSTDASAKTNNNDGTYPRFQMSNSVQNAVVAKIGTTMVYTYATASEGIDAVDEFLEKIGY